MDENPKAMSLRIHFYGEDVLRRKAEEVPEVNEEIRGLAREMLDVMYREGGLGLAAEQVGRTERMCVIDVPPDVDQDDAGERENPDVEMPLVLINPRIVAHSEEVQVGPEGCLSFPDIYARVERWYEVEAEYLDLDGKPRRVRARGLLARAVQHELDHLDGVLLVDRMSPVKRAALSGKLKRLARRARRESKG